MNPDYLKRAETYFYITQLLDKNMTTQEQILNAVRGSNWIVGSVDAKGTVSFSPNPNIHYSTGSARAECKRLATANPGKAFFFVQLAGAELVPVTSISI